MNGILPFLICEIHLETSRQFVASVFGTPLVLRIHGNLYLFNVVTSLEYIVTTQQYCVVTWYYIESIFPDPICEVHLEIGCQLVASVFGVVCLVGKVTITTFVTCNNMRFI